MRVGVHVRNYSSIGSLIWAPFRWPLVDRLALGDCRMPLAPSQFASASCALLADRRKLLKTALFLRSRTAVSGIF